LLLSQFIYQPPGAKGKGYVKQVKIFDNPWAGDERTGPTASFRRKRETENLPWALGKRLASIHWSRLSRVLSAWRLLRQCKPLLEKYKLATVLSFISALLDKRILMPAVEGAKSRWSFSNPHFLLPPFENSCGVAKISKTPKTKWLKSRAARFKRSRFRYTNDVEVFLAQDAGPPLTLARINVADGLKPAKC